MMMSMLITTVIISTKRIMVKIHYVIHSLNFNMVSLVSLICHFNLRNLNGLRYIMIKDIRRNILIIIILDVDYTSQHRP